MSELVDKVPAGVLNADPRLWRDDMIPELVRDLVASLAREFAKGRAS